MCRAHCASEGIWLRLHWDGGGVSPSKPPGTLALHDRWHTRSTVRLHDRLRRKRPCAVIFTHSFCARLFIIISSSFIIISISFIIISSSFIIISSSFIIISSSSGEAWSCACARCVLHGRAFLGPGSLAARRKHVCIYIYIYTHLYLSLSIYIYIHVLMNW